MGYFDTLQICLGGHPITDSYDSSPSSRKDYCPDCGKETIHKCPYCGKKLRGKYQTQSIDDSQSTINKKPLNCDNCGLPFPWALIEKIDDNNDSEQTSLAPIQNLRQVCKRFHSVALQLKCRYSQRETLTIEDEYDTQDLLHSLLHIFFDDIRQEEWTPSYAGNSSRVDFLLKKEEIVIEVKKSRKSMSSKQLVDQLIIDIAKYRSHPNCKTLFCFIYDPDHLILNRSSIISDLEKSDKDISVEVFFVPSTHQ